MDARRDRGSQRSRGLTPGDRVLILPHWRAHPGLHFRIGTVKRRYDYPTFRLIDIDLGGGNVVTVNHDCCEAA